MLDIVDLYQAASNRFSCSYFHQDKYPEKETIQTILEESLKITPVFSNHWNHRLDVYGPEYAEDKRKVCIQTVEDDKARDKFDTRRRAELGIDVLYPKLKTFEKLVESNKLKLGGFQSLAKNNTYSFNTQVMAPYLLKFSLDQDKFAGKVRPEGERPESDNGWKLKAMQSSMAHAQSIAIIANYYEVDASFCGCTILNDENKNAIWYDDENLIVFMGLGFKHPGCFDSPGSKHGDSKPRPEFNDIVEWK